MKKILAEIQDGAFARKWIEENEQGRPQVRAPSAQKERAAPDREGRRASCAR